MFQVYVRGLVRGCVCYVSVSADWLAVDVPMFLLYSRSLRDLFKACASYVLVSPDRLAIFRVFLR